METNKEYEYRCFCHKLIEFIEQINDDENLCDCGNVHEMHDEDCYKVLVDKDTEYFTKELQKIHASVTDKDKND